jgi:hypothetical protein
MAKSSGASSGNIVTVVPPAPAAAPPPAPAMPAALAASRNAALFLVQRVSEGMTLCVLLLSAVLAIAGITEISSRQQARAQVDSMERDETALIMNHMSSVTTSQSKDVSPSAPSVYGYMVSLAKVRAYAMEARGQLDSLAVRGAGKSDRGVAPILADYQAAVSSVRNRLLVDAEMESLTGMASKRSPTSGALAEPPWVESLGLQIRDFWAQLPLEQARTDYLLAVVVSCCALVGAIISMMREGSARFVTKQVVLGLASGFVAFLSLRGGRSVFMLELTGEVPHFNPYSMAFAGLLVGLFTRKAYELLGVLVHELDGRLRAAVQGPSVEKPTPASEPTQRS